MGPILASHPPAVVADVPDDELLRRYLASRDPTALEALIRRHGGMVLGVCRRVLGNPHDADDAFQATFLVFVRKAASVRPAEMIGPWLYGVATRTALKARALAARRRAREKQVDALPDVVAPAVPVAADWLPLLDREVSRLPVKYRLPVLLCDLHGLTRADAAQQLGVREGTLSSRLARARALLRRRLSKRGAGAAVLVAAVLFPTATVAAAPAPLVEATVRAATAFAAGSVLTTPSAMLATAVLASLKRARLAVAAAVVVGLGVLIGGGLQATRPVQPAAVVDARTDQQRLQGEWEIVSAEVDGANAGQVVDALKSMPMDFQGDRLSLFDSDFILNPTTSPKQIDLTCRHVEPPNNVIRGIFEVTGDDLKLCISAPGRERPTAFITEPNSWRTLMILKRRPAPQ